MFLNFIVLLTAISISGVAAYYSIVGLTAIFSGVFIPIIIMGGVLEFGKIVTTVWLHVNWEKVGWPIRWYLSIAVVVLMFVTSMGIFGFLSRAHIDATSSVGDNQLIIEQLDQQIAVERQRISDSQHVIAQMDAAINNILNQSTNAKTIENQRGNQVANQANTLRNNQKKERDALNKTIDDTNKRIGEINQQKLKLQQSQARVEAEVGPIKYIAQLIYGDSINKDLLEHAVRWVIIIIVAVFDPLAVCLILAVTMAISVNKKEQEHEIRQEVGSKNNEEDSRRTQEETATRDISGDTQGAVPAPIAEPVIQYIDREVIVEKIIEVPVVEYKTIEVEKIVEVEKPVEIFTRVEVEVEKIVEVIKEVHDHDRMFELAREIDNLLGEMKNKDHIIGQLKAEIVILENPDDFVVNDAVFGKTLPIGGTTGQLFVQNSSTGLQVHKWNGDNWIPVDKTQNDSYLLDDPITDGIITSLATGELSWDLLTTREQEAIEPLLKDNFKFARR